MLPMVNEADAMSAELDKKVKFELALVSPQARGLKEGKTEVQLCSLLFCGIFAITRLSIVRSNSKGFIFNVVVSIIVLYLQCFKHSLYVILIEDEIKFCQTSSCYCKSGYLC